ncbi:MAG TPA: Fic family protein [Candidatus Paceibacterota bacterium]|nr:Fic family protein [Candidatus Paceibacterota bacterium]
MNKLNKRQLDILDKMPFEEKFSSSDILKIIGKKQKISLVTIKRDLDYLVSFDYLERIGKGRATVYQKTMQGILLSPVDVAKYMAEEPDVRNGRSDFNFSLFEKFPIDVFSDEEKMDLKTATIKYRERVKNISSVVQTKELERFVIELSWKSSKIEGNTYTLLDTERLIREGVPAEGHSKNEAKMILNHKKAFSFIMNNFGSLRTNGINQKFTEKVHELLVEGLGVNSGVRKGLVGIIGTKYKPLDNKYQIDEALSSLYEKVKKMKDPYNRALAMLVGISYIQPFEDGNKRTARLLCNAMLLVENCVPLSYRSIDENIYREAILVFYEKNSVIPMKKIFIEQYLFSADNYLVK